MYVESIYHWLSRNSGHTPQTTHDTPQTAHHRPYTPYHIPHTTHHPPHITYKHHLAHHEPGQGPYVFMDIHHEYRVYITEDDYRKSAEASMASGRVDAGLPILKTVFSPSIRIWFPSPYPSHGPDSASCSFPGKSRPPWKYKKNNGCVQCFRAWRPPGSLKDSPRTPRTHQGPPSPPQGLPRPPKAAPKAPEGSPLHSQEPPNAQSTTKPKLLLLLLSLAQLITQEC